VTASVAWGWPTHVQSCTLTLSDESVEGRLVLVGGESNATTVVQLSGVVGDACKSCTTLFASEVSATMSLSI
jgi:hypothetical protein